MAKSMKLNDEQYESRMAWIIFHAGPDLESQIARDEDQDRMELREPRFANARTIEALRELAKFASDCALHLESKRPKREPKPGSFEELAAEESTFQTAINLEPYVEPLSDAVSRVQAYAAVPITPEPAFRVGDRIVALPGCVSTGGGRPPAGALGTVTGVVEPEYMPTRYAAHRYDVHWDEQGTVWEGATKPWPIASAASHTFSGPAYEELDPPRDIEEYQ